MKKRYDDFQLLRGSISKIFTLFIVLFLISREKIFFLSRQNFFFAVYLPGASRDSASSKNKINWGASTIQRQVARETLNGVKCTQIKV